jgi:phage/plasmid-like protein (TIGR03299 family)
MAHELLIEDGAAAMFYVGDPPWHGLGQRLDAPATAARAMAAARLDWRVRKVPLYIAGGTRLHEVPGKYAVVREDAIGNPGCRALGIVGESYQVLQNRDAFGFFDPIVGEGAAVYHTAGALGAGERVWILAKLPGDIVVARRDVVERFLLLSNSHDGGSAVQVKFTPIRVVCSNTLTQALSRGATYRARHDRDLLAGLHDVRKAMGFITERYDAIGAAFDALARVEMDGRALRAYLARVFPPPADADDERAWERVDAQRHWAAHLFAHGLGNGEAGIAGTLWAAYNAVTELVDHGGGRLVGPRAAANGRSAPAPGGPPRRLPPRRRLESCWFGAGHRTKLRAWEAAMEIARARGRHPVTG